MASFKKLASKETWKGAVINPDKKDWTETTAGVVVDLAAAVLGGWTGSYLGKWAIPVGVGMSATGHATGHRWVSAMGIGCIAAPFDPVEAETFRTTNPKFDLKAEMEAGKQRAKDYTEMLKEKFFINRFKKKSPVETTEEPVSGFDQPIGKATLDALTEFDQQIMSDGIEYQAKNDSPDGVTVSGVELDEIQHII